MCFSGRSEKQDGRPGLWLVETFSTSPLKPLNGIQRNLTGSKISRFSTKLVFFGPIRKTRWPPWPLIGWDIFDISTETIEQNSMKLNREQDLNVLYQVFVFWADWKNKMADLASDWLRHFRHLLLNSWTEFNETWQEARSQCPLPNLCFSGRLEKQDGRHGLWLAETFSTSPLKPLNGIQRNLTGSKISMSSTKFVFFGPIGKTRWQTWPLIGWDIFDISSETAERNSMKLDRKQDLNVLYQVCIFSGQSVNKIGRLGWLLKKVAHCTQVHDMWPFGPLVKNSYIFYTPDFTMENSLSYVIFCWFFATTAYQRIIFIFLVRTKLVKNSVKVSYFSSQFPGKNCKKKICYFNYVKRRVRLNS